MLGTPQPQFRLAAAIGAGYDRYVAAACAKPGRSAALLTLACLPALALSIAFFSHIEAGLQELLPPTAPSVRALTELHALVGGKSHLAVIAYSPDRAANEDFISELTERLKARNLPEVRSIEGDVKAERAWLLRRALLLMPRSDFDRLLARFDAAAQSEKERLHPLRLDLGEDEAPPPFDWTTVEREVDSELSKHDRYPSGFLETANGRRVVALIWLNGSEVDLAPAERLMAAVRREIQALRPRFPSMQVAFNGEVPNLVEEHAAILADLSVSTVFVVFLVGACISFYFRSVRAVATAVLTLLPGLLFAFALGRLTVGGLNSNTTFLGTIIAGNGINYPLLLLAYYRAQPTTLTREKALSAAARQALPGTLGAALTASAAYGGLAASDFRGFSQFGWLGGWGMALVWVGTYLAAPILVALFRPPRRLARSTRVQHLLNVFFSKGPLSKGICAGAVAIVLASTAVGVVRASRSGVYEMNLQALRNRESLRHGSASWDLRMSELFGVWLNPVVALAENPLHREAAASELRRVFAEEDAAGLQSVETFERFVPPAEDQRFRLAQLERIAPMVRRVPPAEIPEKLRPRVLEWFADRALGATGYPAQHLSRDLRASRPSWSHLPVHSH
jgi:predicted exporter